MSRNRLDIDTLHPTAGRIRTSVLCDPSPRQLVAFLNTAPSRQLRGTACLGQLLVYPAYEATHHQVRLIFGMPSILEDGTDFWVIPEDEDPLSPDWSVYDDDPVRDGLRLIVGSRGDDPAIRRITEWFGVTKDLVPPLAP